MKKQIYTIYNIKTKEIKNGTKEELKSFVHYGNGKTIDNFFSGKWRLVNNWILSKECYDNSYNGKKYIK